MQVGLLLQFGHAGRFTELRIGVDLGQDLLQGIAKQRVIIGDQYGECIGAQWSPVPLFIAAIVAGAMRPVKG